MKHRAARIYVACWFAGLSACANDIRVEDGGRTGAAAGGAAEESAGHGGAGSSPTVTAGPGSGGASSEATSANTGASTSTGSLASGATASSSGAGGSIPADGATNDCQLLASVGAWYDGPQGDACTVCIRHMSGEDGWFTSCSELGQTCLLDSDCHDLMICFSNGSYSADAISSCYATASAPSQTKLKDFLDCALPWCGAPDKCAYSGDVPGCTIDAP